MLLRPIFSKDKQPSTDWILGPEDTVTLRQCLFPNFHQKSLQNIRTEDLVCLVMMSKLWSAGNSELAKLSCWTAPLVYAPTIGWSICWWLVHFPWLSPHISVLIRTLVPNRYKKWNFVEIFERTSCDLEQCCEGKKAICLPWALDWLGCCKLFPEEVYILCLLIDLQCI